MDAVDIDDSLSYKPQHPLPEEIQKMSKGETVCQYCGVSYLIHSEIKKLENKLENYRKEVERLRHFDEREAELKIRIEELGKELKTLSEKWKLESEKAMQVNQQIEEKDACISSLENQLNVLRKASVTEKKTWQEKFLNFQTTCYKILQNLSAVKDTHKSFQEQFYKYQKEYASFTKCVQKEFMIEMDKVLDHDKVLKDKIEKLVKEHESADSIHKHSLQVLQQQCEDQVKQLTIMHDESMKSREVDKHKYQEQIRRLKETKETKESESEKTVRDLKKVIEDLTTLLNKQQTNGNNEKKLLQSSLNRCKEEKKVLVIERDKAKADHKNITNEMNETFSQKMRKYEERIEMQNLELRNQANELRNERNGFEKQKQYMEEKQKGEMLQVEGHFEDLRQQKEAFQEKEDKMKTIMESMQKKCESAVNGLHQTMEDLKKEHGKEVSILLKDLSQVKNQLSEAERTQKIDDGYTHEECKNYVGMIHELRRTVEGLQTEVKSKEEKAHQQEGEIRSLRECVRRECEERYELTEALSNARTELLLLQRFSTNNNKSSSKAAKHDIFQPTPPVLPLTGGRKTTPPLFCGRKSLSSSSTHSGSSEESWTRHLANKKRSTAKSIQRGGTRNSFDGDLRKANSLEHDTTTSSIKNKLRISINNNR